MHVSRLAISLDMYLLDRAMKMGKIQETQDKVRRRHDHIALPEAQYTQVAWLPNRPRLKAQWYHQVPLLLTGIFTVAFICNPSTRFIARICRHVVEAHLHYPDSIRLHCFCNA
jgi:hypothetical protein